MTIPTKKQTSCGGVVFRQENGRFQIVLIAIGSQPNWQLPKGIMDPGETREQTAVREVREETGLTATLLQYVGLTAYSYINDYGEGLTQYDKTVHFFLMRYLHGETNDHDDEVEEARWFDLDEALHTLTHDSERALVQKAKKLLTEVL